MTAAGPPATLDLAGLDGLIAALRARGWTVIGPVVRGGAVLADEIGSAADLPSGWIDEQEAGRYRLVRDGRPALFDWTVGPASLKAFLHPAAVTLWRARRGDGALAFEAGEDAPRRLAVIGVRACDLAALAILDRVLLGGAYADPGYRARRDGLFVVAVQCGRAGGTCFCASMGTGPAVTAGHDLVLTELVEGGGPAFVAEAGSARGAEVLGALPARAALPAEVEAARARVAEAARGMGRALDTAGLPALLARSLEHPRWDHVAARCLACANCTSVCPTCFCATVEDVADLAGASAVRVRRWDSCFALEHSHIHGGSVRATTRARYRQWLTHKLGTWHDQFGTAGCVGCGRCITWCPAGIDLTEEARALRERPHRKEARRAVP